MDHHRTTRVLAVASGKDGVGRANIVTKLAFALTKLPKNVLVMNPDCALESLNSLFGLTSCYTLAQRFLGAKNLGEIIIEGPGGMCILPDSSGVQQPTNLSTEQKLALLAESDRFDETGDVMLIDTDLEISGNALYFAMAAREITMVMCLEPMAIARACAFMKVLACEHGHRTFQLPVNAVATAHEREMVCQTLQFTTQQSRDIESYPLGWIPHDIHVEKAVRQLRPSGELSPNVPASRAFLHVAIAICALSQ